MDVGIDRVPRIQIEKCTARLCPAEERSCLLYCLRIFTNAIAEIPLLEVPENSSTELTIVQSLQLYRVYNSRYEAVQYVKLQKLKYCRRTFDVGRRMEAAIRACENHQHPRHFFKPELRFTSSQPRPFIPHPIPAGQTLVSRELLTSLYFAFLECLFETRGCSVQSLFACAWLPDDRLHRYDCAPPNLSLLSAK